MDDSKKYQDLWRLIGKYKFEIDFKIYSFIQCGLCKNILKNASYTPCGCRFCLNCIKSYLGIEEKLCPCGKAGYKEQLINFKNDIQVDHPLNSTISKIKVKCPEKYCEYRDKLKHIENHFLNCRTRSYSDFSTETGFSESNFASERYERNTLESTYNSKLFMGWSENFGNEMEIIKKSIETLFKENMNLKREMQSLRNQITRPKNHFDSRKEIEFDSIKSKNGNILLADENHFTFITEKSDSIEKNNEYLWKIERFNDKIKKAKYWINTEVSSEPFYSHEKGYKLRLYCYPLGFGDGKGTHCSIVFHIMKGEFDMSLPWPMKHTITIALIHHDTGKMHISYSYTYSSTKDNLKYVYEKPTEKENRGYGTSRFIKLDELLTNPSVYNNDTILVKCFIKCVT